MGEYWHNFKVVAQGRGPSPLNSVECAKFYGSGSEKLFDKQHSRSGRKPLLMLQHTFCRLPGISVATERQLWAAGIDSWEAALAVDRGRLPRRHQRALADHLPASLEHLA